MSDSAVPVVQSVLDQLDLPAPPSQLDPPAPPSPALGPPASSPPALSPAVRMYLDSFSASRRHSSGTPVVGAHPTLQAATPPLPHLVCSSPARADPLARTRIVLDSSSALVARLAEMEEERQAMAVALAAEKAALTAERARAAVLAAHLDATLRELRGQQEETRVAAASLAALTEVVSGLLGRVPPPAVRGSDSGGGISAHLSPLSTLVERLKGTELARGLL